MLKKWLACIVMVTLLCGITAAQAAEYVYQPLILHANDLNGNTVFGLGEEYDGKTSSDEGVALLDYGGAFYAESEERSSEFEVDIATEPSGFPVDGKVTVEGIPFVLACGEDPEKAYDGNDSIRLWKDYTTHTINLDTLGVYDTLYVLATAAGPGGDNYVPFTVTLTYTDGEQSETSFDVYDWYNTNDDLDLVRCKDFARVYYGSDQNEEDDFWIEVWGIDGPHYLYALSMDADETRLLQSIQFSTTGTAVSGDDHSKLEYAQVFCGIYAVTGKVRETAPNPPVATNATEVKSSSFVANWNGVAGATGYRLDVSADPEFKSVFSAYNNRDVGNVTHFFVDDVVLAEAVYYRVRAVNNYGQSLSSNAISVGDSAAESEFPQTGDGAMPVLWFALAFTSVLALTVCGRKRRTE